MTRGTTPSYTLYFTDDIDLTAVQGFNVTLKQGHYMITKQDVEVNAEEKTISFSLTQAETLGFKDGDAEMQVRGKFANKIAFATKICRVPVNRVLLEGVI